MAKLAIDELDLSPALIELVQTTAAEMGKRQAQEFIEDYKKKMALPRFMGYLQAASYMGTSYNTLKYVFIAKMGLRVVMIDGYEKIDQKDADAFLEMHKNKLMRGALGISPFMGRT